MTAPKRNMLEVVLLAGTCFALCQGVLGIYETLSRFANNA
jgi:hypothetical protein